MRLAAFWKRRRRDRFGYLKECVKHDDGADGAWKAQFRFTLQPYEYADND
jgi:hypothetical protein